jgi:hypothetical protein
MNWRYLLLAIALLAGFASGPSSLESAAASRPPIDWGSLVFLFLGSLVALPVLLGFQALLGKAKALRWGWSLFLFCAVYFTASGFAALVVAFIGPGLVPHSFLFLVLGVAMLLGLGVIKALFASKFADGV